MTRVVAVLADLRIPLALGGSSKRNASQCGERSYKRTTVSYQIAVAYSKHTPMFRIETPSNVRLGAEGQAVMLIE